MWDTIKHSVEGAKDSEILNAKLGTSDLERKVEESGNEFYSLLSRSQTINYYLKTLS